jgi:plasmid replication initiation protein
VDADGNGRFSFPEIKNICKLSLSKFEDPNYEAFREELADFFAKYIFKIMEKDPDHEEIPVTDFKKAIYRGSQEQRDILAMFCCADAQVKENQDKQKVKNIMGMSIAALAKQIKQ